VSRKNLPSRSLERTIPEVAEADKDRDGGTLIHAALAGDIDALKLLTPEQVESKEECERLEYEEASKLIEIDQPHAVYREQRRWLHDPKTLMPIFSGQPDIERVQGKTAVICDWKSGWIGAERAEQNAQIMCLAVLAASQWDVERVFGLIIQPHAFPRVSVVEYGPADLVNAERIIRDVLSKSEEPDAPRVAGDHCRFCKGKLQCVEYQGRELAIELYGQTAELTHEKLLTMFAHWKTVQGMGAHLESLLKRMLAEDPNAFGGKLTLEEGSSVPVIPDAGKAWQKLSGTFTSEEFISFCEASITPMRKRLKANAEARGEKCTLKEAKKRISELLGDAVTYRKNQPSLVFNPAALQDKAQAVIDVNSEEAA
jgi:hypothetical protein